MTSIEPNTVDARIEKFILKHHVLTLATSSEQGCYCSNMFYAYDKDYSCFVFTSALSTRHAAEAIADSRVAANIVVESKVVGILQGLQICGTLRPESEFDLQQQKTMRKAYLKRFPYAAAADLELWFLEPNFMKFTDNKLGFGKKLIWQK